MRAPVAIQVLPMPKVGTEQSSSDMRHDMSTSPCSKHAVMPALGLSFKARRRGERYGHWFFFLFLLMASLAIMSSAHAQVPTASAQPERQLDVMRCNDASAAAGPECRKALLKLAASNRTSRDSSVQGDLPKRSSGAVEPGFAEQELVMYAGEVILLSVGKIDRVAIGNGKVVSSSVLDDNRLLIIAQDVGDTNLLLWSKSALMRNIRVRVTAQNMERIKGEAVSLLSGIPGIKIASVGDKIFIEGYDLSDADLNRVKALASQYPSVIDRTVGKARPPKPAEPSAMVMFDLYFVEFKKSFLQNLGVSWQGSFNGFNVGMFGESASGPVLLRPGIGGASGVTYDPPLPDTRVRGLSAAANISLSVPAVINMAVDSGDAVLLAAPKIASRSGSKAKFTAGGEVPLPTANQLMGTTVTFKPYGILLEVEPQINADGSVSGIVRAEVSQIDPSVSVQNIPGFLTRRTEADFYSTSGQAVVLSGLYSMELGEDTTKVPLLGDIPLLKALFSSTAENRKSSELVVFIVPHLHSANASRNRQILNTTNAVFDEQSRKLRGDETDVLTKLKPSPQIWGLEAMENTLNKPGSWDLESIETVPPGSVKDKGSADKPRDGAGQ